MATSVLHLTVNKGPKKGETLDRKPGTLIRIGRVVKGNTFAIKDPAISQNHLVIKFLPEISRWTLEDLDTSNGTLMNDVTIPPSSPFPLSDGDIVKIGQDTSISVKIDIAEAEAEKRNAGNRRGKPKKADEPSVEAAGHAPRRGRSKKVDDSSGVEAKDENLNPVVVEEPKNLGKGRSRRGDSSRVSRRDEGLGEIAEAPLEEKRNLRRGRSKRVDDFVGVATEIETLNPIVSEKPKNLRRGRSKRVDDFVGVATENETLNPIVAEKPKNLGRGRPKRRNYQDEVFDAAAGVLVEESMSSRRADLRNVPEENDILGSVAGDSVDVPKGARRGKRAPVVKVPGEEEIPSSNSEAEKVAGEEVLDGGSIGGDRGKMVGSEEEAETGSVEEEMVVDIEKMTLGEWFDSMEKFLPMAINDVAEEIIASLREKARRFDEFIGKDSDAC